MCRCSLSLPIQNQAPQRMSGPVLIWITCSMNNLWLPSLNVKTRTKSFGVLSCHIHTIISLKHVEASDWIRSLFKSQRHVLKALWLQSLFPFSFTSTNQLFCSFQGNLPFCNSVIISFLPLEFSWHISHPGRASYPGLSPASNPLPHPLLSWLLTVLRSK